MLLTVFFTVPQIASALSPYQPPERRIADFNGVDLAGSTWNKTETFLTIGDPSNGGLSWSYSGIDNHDSYTGLLHLNTIATMSGGFPSYTASSGESTTIFAQPGPSAASNYAILAHVGSTWTVATKGGMIYTYDELVSVGPYDSYSKLLSIQRPNGNIITINYSSCPSAPLSCRISSVVSNMGYALKYDYDGSGNLIKVWAVNMSAHVCDATVTTCDAYDNYITKNPTTGGIADALGNTTIILTDPFCGASADKQCTYFYQSPSGAQITTSYDYYGRIETLTNAVGTWTYTYTDLTPEDYDHKGPHKTVVKDPNNVIYMQSSATLSDPRVLWKKDGLVRQTSYSYTGFPLPGTYNTINSTVPAGVTLPEGNSTTFTFDTLGRVTQVTNTPKAGSGLSATSITATYEATCANLKTCAQPLTTTDARGKTTINTYDATHGGVLTVISPADGAGLTPKNVNTYAQYTAQRKSGPSTWVNAGTIWMPTATSTCVTAVTCDGTINQLKTTTAYGTYNLLPSSVTKAAGDNSLSVTTTMGYDAIGNTISVDGPRTDVDDTSYKTYDANRRPIFEISADPDGGGALKRLITKHTYNSNGRESRTDNGSGNATNGSDFVPSAFKRMTFDAVGRVIKTETVQP